jgi:hypothetical protein
MSSATYGLRNNANIVADAASKIVQQPIKQSSSIKKNQEPLSGLFNSNVNIEEFEGSSDHNLLTQTMRIKQAEYAYKASATLYSHG